MNKVVFYLFLLICPLAVAEKTSAVVSQDISTLLTQKLDFRKKENRNLVANALIMNLKEINSFIPQNTPEEERWRQKEAQESSSNSERLIHYASTEIFAKYWLKGGLEGMIKLLSASTSSSISLKNEAIIWVSIGSELGSNNELYNDNFRILIDHQLIKEEKLSKITFKSCKKIGCFYQYKHFGSDIINQIALPIISAIPEAKT